jgi:hypothetical protein
MSLSPLLLFRRKISSGVIELSLPAFWLLRIVPVPGSETILFIQNNIYVPALLAVFIILIFLRDIYNYSRLLLAVTIITAFMFYFSSAHEHLPYVFMFLVAASMSELLLKNQKLKIYSIFTLIPIFPVPISVYLFKIYPTVSSVQVFAGFFTVFLCLLSIKSLLIFKNNFKYSKLTLLDFFSIILILLLLLPYYLLQLK